MEVISARRCTSKQTKHLLQTEKTGAFFVEMPPLRPPDSAEMGPAFLSLPQWQSHHQPLIKSHIKRAGLSPSPKAPRRFSASALKPPQEQPSHSTNCPPGQIHSHPSPHVPKLGTVYLSILSKEATWPNKEHFGNQRPSLKSCSQIQAI